MMTEKADIPSLERITFFHGQRLTARDLAEFQRAHRELRWLHNRSLHGWGIGIGLKVSGERGDSAVTIEPGYGVDCLGREVILTEERVQTVPSVAGGPSGGEAVYYLVAAYQEDENQKAAERRPGVCLPEGTVRLTEEPLIEWRRPGRLEEGMEFVLAQAWIQNCQLSRPLSFSARRYARLSQQPYIAAAQTVVGKTAWQPWKIDEQIVGVLARVDTSPARFHTTPRYVAHVAGERSLTGVQSETGGALSGLALGFPAVVSAGPQGFTLEMLLPELHANVNPPPLRNHEAPKIVNQLGWHVVWMGIEA